MKLIWSDPAVSDLEAIRDYIFRDSEYYATRFIAKIIEAAERLEELPRIGRRVPEAPDAPEVREILYRNYRVLYRVESERILILGVIHSSRDLASLRPGPLDVD